MIIPIGSKIKHRSKILYIATICKKHCAVSNIFKFFLLQ